MFTFSLTPHSWQAPVHFERGRWEPCMANRKARSVTSVPLYLPYSNENNLLRRVFNITRHILSPAWIWFFHHIMLVYCLVTNLFRFSQSKLWDLSGLFERCLQACNKLRRQRRTKCALGQVRGRWFILYGETPVRAVAMFPHLLYAFFLATSVNWICVNSV